MLIFYSACSFDYREGRLSEELSKDLPNSVMSDYTHTSVKNGSPVFRIHSAQSKIYKEDHRAELSRVYFQEFDDSGETVTEGTAERATVFTRSNNVELKGSINFEYHPQNFTVEAPYLYWNNDKRLLEGKEDELVHLRKEDGSSIRGTDFSSSGAHRRLVFDGSVEGTFAEQEAEGDTGNQATHGGSTTATKAKDIATNTATDGSTSGNAAEENEEKSSRFTFSGDSTSIDMSEGNRRTTLTGNARITSEKISIRAEKIELYGEDFRFARCTGEVETEEKEKGLRLRSDNLFYDRRKELLRIEGYNEMVDKKNELVAKSGYLEHRGEEDITVFQIGVRILKATDETKLVGRGEFVRYDRENEQLIFSGMPVVTWEKDTYEATRIILNLESDEIRLEGNVEGTVTPKEEDS